MRRLDYTWNNNGNLTSDGVRTYDYDHAHRLKQVIEGSLTTQLAYNGDGVRTGKTVDGMTTDYVLDLAATLPVVISDTDAIYLYGLDIIAEQLALRQGSGQAQRYYCVHDGLGTVRQLLDNTGQIAETYAYDPFGVPLVSDTVPNPYRFTGEAWDAEVGLLYLRARYYQPETGRFITKDPWLGDLWRPETLDPYVYVGNNPVNYTDPTGLQGPDRPGVPTPHPPDQQRASSSCSLHSIPCMPVVPVAEPPPPQLVVRAQNPGRGLLFQGTIVRPPLRLLFLDTGFGGAAVDSGLEATVRIYVNGAYVDIFDTYDTSNVAMLEILKTFPGMMFRYGAVVTTRGEEVNFYFTTLERQNVGFKLVSLPFLTVSLPPGPAREGPLDLIPAWQRGRGEASAWVPADQDLAIPSKVRMSWLITPSGISLGFAASLVPSLGYGSYEVSLEQMYGDLRIRRCAT